MPLNEVLRSTLRPQLSQMDRSETATKGRRLPQGIGAGEDSGLFYAENALAGSNGTFA